MTVPYLLPYLLFPKLPRVAVGGAGAVVLGFFAILGVLGLAVLWCAYIYGLIHWMTYGEWP